MSAELKPCPFCGAQPEFKPYKRDGLTLVCPTFGCGISFSQRTMRFSLDWLGERMAERWNTRTEQNKGAQTREQAACARVLAAVRAYLPPDGITKDEFISRVIEAVDGPEFNAEQERILR